MHSPLNPSRLTRRECIFTAVAFLAPIMAACSTGAMAMPTPVELSVVDRETGQPLQVHRWNGQSFVAGRPGVRYALRLQNRSSGRALAVLSVDGVNVISGQTANWSQAGYVLEPWTTYDIAGWRKSDTAIAAFEFAPLSQSYAARTGRPGHVGVLGMAVFLERPAAAPSPRTAAAPAAAADRAEAAPGASRSAGTVDGAMNDAQVAKRERLGTAHGQREWSVVEQTDFQRMSHSPQAVVRIEYDSFENLVAAGIISPVRRHARPEPFPGNERGVDYVPDPPAR